MLNLKDHIRGVPDFPKPGILFYDIGTLIQHAGAWHETVTRLADAVRPEKPDILIGIESRGFLVAAPLAIGAWHWFQRQVVRKKGKLPGKTIAYNYKLEYRRRRPRIEIQDGTLKLSGQRAVMVDDLLATGGTRRRRPLLLARQVGATVTHAAFIIELGFLEGRKKLDVPVTSLVVYDK